MGIKNFKKVFKNHGELSLKQLKGLTLAIDAMGEIYRGVLGTSKVDQLTDKSGNPTNYIGVLIGVIRNFYLADVKQIWVFDSPTPHPLKIVLVDRSQKREKAEKTLSDMAVADGEAKHIVTQQTVGIVEVKVGTISTNANKEEDPMFAIPEGYVVMDDSDNTSGDDEDKATKTKDGKSKKHQLQKQAFRITSQMIHNVQRILDGFDIPYIIAPPGIEAEHVAAQLTQIGKADAVFTNDPDALLFGASRIIMRNRDKKVKKSKYTEFIEYHLNLLLEEHEVTRRDLAKVAVVLGCDFYSDKNDPNDDDDARPYFKGIGAKSVLGKLKSLERKKLFADPMVAKAMDVYFEEVPPYEIKNELSLQNKKGARPFYSSKKISALVKWLVDDLGFEAKPLVKRFRETFGLEKIKYKKGDSRKGHPNDPFVGKNLEYTPQ